MAEIKAYYEARIAGKWTPVVIVGADFRKGAAFNTYVQTEENGERYFLDPTVDLRLMDPMDLLTRGPVYLTVRKGGLGGYDVSDWPGSLRIPCTSYNESRGWGFGGSYPVVHVRFRAPDGSMWWGRNAGDGQILWCKKLKDQGGARG